jgi:hypothetical protein
MPAASLLPAAALLQLNRLAVRTGLRPRADGWRRAAGLVLRAPRSTFILSAFGLNLWSDAPRTTPAPLADSQAHFAKRFDTFLRSERSSHIRIARARHEDRAQPHTEPSCTLAFQPWLDGPDRFAPPSAWADGSPAPSQAQTPTHAPLLSAVARIGPASHADLWLRVNHVGADGVPMQDLLTSLERAWGLSEDVLFPTPADFPPRTLPCEGCPESDVAHTQFFLDFAPLLAWRKAANATLPEPMTVSAAILWRLAQLPPFRALHLGTTAEVEAVDALAPGVGVVVTRPADFAARDPHSSSDSTRALAAYVRDFNRQLALTRKRQSPSCKSLDAAAHLPPRLARTLLHHALENVPTSFGTLALTMLKDAKVFGAPIAERGHPHGFIAIGSLNLPTRDGQRVGCVTIKGKPSIVSAYPELITEAMR